MERAPAGPASAMLTSEVLFSFIFQAAFSQSAVHPTSIAGAALIMLSVGTMMLAQKRAPAAAPTAPTARGKQGGEESCAFRHADSASQTEHDTAGTVEPDPDGAESKLVWRA